MPIELKPCPFCGGKPAFVPRAVNIVLQKDPSDPKFGVSVICGRCSAESANMVDEAHAAAKWNARTPGVKTPLEGRDG
jgi:Lar family restriction alleviation protein